MLRMCIHDSPKINDEKKPKKVIDNSFFLKCWTFCLAGEPFLETKLLATFFFSYSFQFLESLRLQNRIIYFHRVVSLSQFPFFFFFKMRERTDVIKSRNVLCTSWLRDILPNRCRKNHNKYVERKWKQMCVRFCAFKLSTVVYIQFHCSFSLFFHSFYSFFVHLIQNREEFIVSIFEHLLTMTFTIAFAFPFWREWKSKEKKTSLGNMSYNLAFAYVHHVVEITDTNRQKGNRFGRAKKTFSEHSHNVGQRVSKRKNYHH